MHPEEIKAAIRMTGTTPSAIADELCLSSSTISQVIHGRGVSAKVRSRISEVTGLPVKTLWPPKKPTQWRRTAPPTPPVTQTTGKQP